MTSAPITALNEILDADGLPPNAASHVHLAGDDPVLPTPYQIGAASAAAIARRPCGRTTLGLGRRRQQRRRLSGKIVASPVEVPAGHFIENNE
jgi:hypothetical protein